MTQSHVTKVYAVKTARISKITTDSAGGATVYAASIQVPGMRLLTLTETYKEAFLRGDNTLLDYEAIRDTVKAVVHHGKLNFDAVAVITGSTVVDSGASPNFVTTNTYTNVDTPGFFRLEAQCWSVDGVGGDYHLTLGKCKIAGTRPFGVADEAFQDFTFEVVAVPPLGTGAVWYSEVLNQTAVAPV